MSCDIESVTIGGNTEKRCVLSVSDLARPMTIGSGWTTVRLAIRMAFSDEGTDITIPRFYFGVIADPSAAMGNGTLTDFTSHFLGVKAGAKDWVRLETPTRYYVSPDSALVAVKRVGMTNTESNLSPSQHLGAYFSASPSLMRWPLYVEIVKGSPDFTVQGVWPAENSSLEFDLSVSDMRDILLENTMADVATALTDLSGMTYLSGTAISMAVDEATDGFLNAACVAWDYGPPNLHISDIYFTYDV